jgi:hypothetical protein
MGSNLGKILCSNTYLSSLIYFAIKKLYVASEGSLPLSTNNAATVRSTTLIFASYFALTASKSKTLS